jgi:methylmalonyl-CoA mutase N-terminal domain/subunit
MTLERLAVDPTIELSQRAKLAELRENRDEKKVAELRVRIESAAKGTENLMPLFIEAVEHDMTLGEIANILREVWGEYVAEGF